MTISRPANSYRGTYDLLPEQAEIFKYIENIAHPVLTNAGYGQISTPIIEESKYFLRSAGEASDIVNKELYRFEDKSNRDISLRPEGTAGVVRAYLSNGLDRHVKPVKLYYTGAMFRYERPQTGRYRQFHQLGIESFGSNSYENEFESIYLAWDILQQIFKNSDFELSLVINNLGDIQSRMQYQEVLKDFLIKNTQNICKDCQTRIDSNPLRALDCKITQCQQIYNDAPIIGDYLSSESKTHFAGLLDLLSAFNIQYQHNTKLVRGLDYYTGTVFEIQVQHKGLGTQNTILAGGKYNNLVEEFGGESTPAFGWAMGLERISILLQDSNISQTLVNYPKVYILNNNNFVETFKLMNILRKQNIYTVCDVENKTINKQFKHAQKTCTYTLEYKIENHNYILKSLTNRDLVHNLDINQVNTIQSYFN